jgi:hypothetical protein
MTKNKAVRVIEVRLDTQGVQNNMAALNKTLETLSDNLETVSQWEMSGFVADLQDMKETLDEILILLGQKIDSGSWMTAFSEITSSAETLLSIVLAFAGADHVPALLEKISKAFSNMGATAGTAGGIFGGLSAGTILGIASVVVLATAVIIRNLDLIEAKFTEVWENHLEPFWDRISTSVESIGESLTTIWDEFLQPIIDQIITIYEPLFLAVIYRIMGAFEVVISRLADRFSAILLWLDGLLQFLSGVFTLDMDAICDGLTKIVQAVCEYIGSYVHFFINYMIIQPVNSLIGRLFSVFSKTVNSILGVVSFIGDIVGQDWEYSFPTNPYQIPYLAKGAVLPANKPFLAMVGDQKHGTNVEAPLATIQEAVANVMVDMIPAMMAGFEAVVNEQRATRQAVESIELGDTVIGQAAARYSRKMAVIKGG